MKHENSKEKEIIYYEECIIKEKNEDRFCWLIFCYEESMPGSQETNFCLAFASLIIPETEKLVKSYKNRDTINLSFHLTWFLWVCLDINYIFITRERQPPIFPLISYTAASQRKLRDKRFLETRLLGTGNQISLS